MPASILLLEPVHFTMQRGMLLGIKARAECTANLERDPRGRGYANITTAMESNGVLYLGSTEQRAIGRLRLDGGGVV